MHATPIAPDPLSFAPTAMTSTAQALARVLATHQPRDVPALPGRTNHIRAGVLVPLMWMPQPVAVLTLRPTTIGHGGEVSFPGGRPEPGDGCLRETALREAREELGVVAPEILGRLSSMPVYTSDHRLEPFVATLAADTALSPCPDEVERVVRVDLDALLARPTVEAIAWHHDGLEHLSPVFVVDDVEPRPDAGPLAVYGATAHTLWELLDILAPLLGHSSPQLRTGRFEWSDLQRWRAHAAQRTPPRV